MKNALFLIIGILFFTGSGFSQVAINNAGAEADASAMLDIGSTEKGMLAPRMTTIQRTTIASPANGLLVYDTDTKSFWYYDNDDSLWVEVVSGVIELNDLSDAITDGNSVFIGENSGINNNGGNYNSALGYASLRDLTTGEYNTAIGSVAMFETETGSYNTSIGYRSMAYNISGEGNVAIGVATNSADNDGDSSTFVGTKSGFSIGGTKNCGYGYGSLAYIDGDRNTAIGSLAGYGDDSFGISTSYNGCVFLGYEAGKNNTADDKLYIENSGSDTPLIGGDFSTDQVDINGTIKITGGTPGNGKVLTSDADGLASWVDNPGATMLNDLGDALTNANSVFVGSGAGENDDGWNYNTGIGKDALPDNTSGEYNTGLGYGSLFYNTTGNYNVAVGHYSISSNIVGDSNTFVGSYSGMDNEGDNNCGFGFGNMRYNIGDNNTAIGHSAGYGTYEPNTSYSGCILIGYESGKNNTSDNKLYIENSDSDTPLIGGDFSTDQVDINGTIKITGGVPGNGKILTSDSDGLASWSTMEEAGGATELNDLSDARTDVYSIFIGTNSGLNDDGYNYNTSVGYGSLKDVTSGWRNVAIGNYSLKSTTSGNQNTSVGDLASESNTTGSENTVLGSKSHNNNTEGSGNIAVGLKALYNNTTGNNNTVVGNLAGYGSNGDSFSGCVFLGYEAGKSNNSDNKLYIENSNSQTPLIGGDFSTDQVDINGTIKITGGTPGNGKVLTSDDNGLASWEPTSGATQINDLSDAVYNGSDLFLGNGAGISNSGSNSSVALGHNALTTNTASDFNTAIGYSSLDGNTGERNTAVGSHSLGANTSGERNTSIGYSSGINNATGSYNTFVGYRTQMNSTSIKVNSTAIGNEAIITASDQVRIGNENVTSIGGEVSWTTLSDGRFKENIKEDVAGLDFIMNLRPVSYTVNKQAFKNFVGSEYQSNNKTSSTRECGFVAQEVEELVKKTGVEFNGVDVPENGDDYYGIRYSQFVMPLVKSVQELNEKLEKENIELKAQNAEMLQRLEKLEEIIINK